MLDEGPSKLYDGLAAILGLEDLVTSQDRLRDARLGREKAHKAAAEMQQKIVGALRATFADDDRARQVVDALDKKEWDLEHTERILAGATAPTEDQTAVGTLQRLAALTAPSVEDIARATDRLRKADEAQRAVAGTIASRARQLSDLLDKALAFHDTHGDGGCPVCDREGALSKQWHEKKKKEASAFREAATAATTAGSEGEAARKAALGLPVPSTQVVERAASVGLDKLGAAAVQSLADWQQVISAGAGVELTGLARNLEMASKGLRTKIEVLRDAAAAELAKREDAGGRWPSSSPRGSRSRVRPCAATPPPRPQGRREVAEGHGGELWDERFAPIADRAQAICDDLSPRQQREGCADPPHGRGFAAPGRLDVTVDGVATAALA
jgi:hypothetical protein